MAKTGGVLLAKCCEELGGQVEVAKAAGISQSLVSRLINEGVQPSLDTAFDIRDALGIPLESWRRGKRRRSGGPRRQGAPSPTPERKAS
jgi:transcriptional regulator with XRE-family HTH domain